jgi:hypothetical protein
VQLELPSGAPAAGPTGEPVTTTTGADGSFALDGVVTGPYLLVVDPPTASGLAPAVIPIDLTAGDVTGITVTLTPAPTSAAPPSTPALIAPRFTG